MQHAQRVLQPTRTSVGTFRPAHPDRELFARAEGQGLEGVLGGGVPGDGEALGMTLVEYGVGITVSMVMLTIFNQLAEEQSK